MPAYESLAPPSPALLALEGRSLWELGLLVPALPALLAAPRGDRHPVLVLPGFTASDASTVPLRGYLGRLGYRVHGWELGRNRGPSPQLEVALSRRLRYLYWRHGRKVSLVGWSLGGIYARELARLHPERVRQVITLGSPFAQSPRATNVWRLFERLRGERIDDLDPRLFERLRRPPPVPSTAIYSRSDGVVHWRACLEPEAPHTDNVEVPGSHTGLGHNALALWVIADRLAQPEDGWRPFERSGLKAFLYPRRARPSRSQRNL